MEALLKIEDLHVAFSGKSGLVEVLKGVDLSIGAGEVQGLVGRSGVGKSVLARSVLRVLEENALVTKGRILFEGHDIYSLSSNQFHSIRGRRLAHISSSGRAALNPMLSIGKQLNNVYLAHHPGDSITRAREEALKSLNAVGINDPARRMKAYPHELSGGMAQRVLIAAALMNDPELIVADDPTGGLDVTIQAQILALIRDLVRSRKMAMLLISRDFGVLAHMADRIAVMQGGSVVENRTREEVLVNPEHSETTSLLEAFRGYSIDGVAN